MKIKFWGVRGSIPCPGPLTVRYGGNTSCIEVRLPETGRLLIIDAGSGIRELGNHLMSHDLLQGPIDTDIFLTHTHWDHIMGFPFFAPGYLSTSQLRIHGPEPLEGDSLEQIMAGQMMYRYFPIQEMELAADIRYIELKEGRIDLGGGLTLTTKHLNHPILCLGYRFEYQGKTFCTAYDTEPFRNLFPTDPDSPDYDELMAVEGQLVAEQQNRAVEQFVAGADLLVYDSQYVRQEYESSKIGWGHSPLEHACETAGRAGVKAMALFHHDPMRSDDQLDELGKIHAQPGRYGATRIFIAREGMEIDL